MKQIPTKIAILFLIIFTLINCNLIAEKYMKNIHKYLFEEGVNLLNKYKTYNEYQYNNGNNPIYNKLKSGSFKEDHSDWIFGYGSNSIYRQNVNVTGVGVLTDWLITNELQSITHFWDADNFDLYERNNHNIESGYTSFTNEYIIHDIPSAVTKIYNTFYNTNASMHKNKAFDLDLDPDNSGQNWWQFMGVNGDSLLIGSFGGEYKISIKSLEDFEENRRAFLVGVQSQTGIMWSDDPYYFEVNDNYWNIFNDQNPYWKYGYVGRAIHLISDMTVPAHVHNDNHAPRFHWEWHTDNCDQYEGWNYDFPINGEGGFLKNNPYNAFWDADMVADEFGGLINLPSDYGDSEFLFDLFYSLNQVTDMFASDDRDGDCNPNPDYPFSDYPFIQTSKTKFENEILPNLPNIQSAHEITLAEEREAIRDVCIPAAIRGIATFLEWYAQKENFNCVELNACNVSGSVSLAGPGDISQICVLFDKKYSSNDFTINPDDYGNYQINLFDDENQFGKYNITFTHPNDIYLSQTLTDININGNSISFLLEDVILEIGSTISGSVSLSNGNDNSRPVENTKIKIISSESDYEYEVNPNSSGEYSAEVPVGTYDVYAILPGYTVQQQSEVVTTQNNPAEVDFDLNYSGTILVSQAPLSQQLSHTSSPAKATEELKNNETVYIDDGTYNSDLNFVGFSDNYSVSVYGSNTENTTLNGQIHGSMWFPGWSVEVHTINFEVSGTNLLSQDLMLSESGNITLANSIITNENGPAFYIPNEIDGFDCACYVTLDNCIIQNCNLSAQNPMSPIHCFNNMTVKNCTIKHNQNDPCGWNDIKAGAIYLNLDEGKEVNIVNNSIFNNTGGDCGAIYCSGSGEIQIKNNVINNNSLFSPDGEAVAIYIDNINNDNSLLIKNNLLYENTISGYKRSVIKCVNSNTQLKNNTITDNPGQKAVVINSGTSEIYNNIITKNKVGIEAHNNCNINYCNVFDNDPNYTGTCNPGSNCISTDPIFVDKDNNDYALSWNSDEFSPCIDAGDPNKSWDADDTPPDMGAVTATAHSYFTNQYDNGSLDNVEWISFPALNTITDSATEALGLLERQGLIDNNPQSNDILDYVEFEDVQEIWFHNIWHNGLGNFDSKQGYKIKLQDSYDDIPIGITGIWKNSSHPIQLYAGQQNWVGCYLQEPASINVAFASIEDEWISIKSEHWAAHRQLNDLNDIKGTVNPGELYIIQVENDCELVWDDSGNPVDPYTREMTDYFVYEEQLEYMAITIDTVYGDTPDEIAVYSGNECLGASKVNDEYPVQILAYPAAGGSKDGSVDFMLYNTNAKEKTKAIKNYLTYNKEISAFVSKPVFYKENNHEVVKLNTDENFETDLGFTIYGNYPNPIVNGITHISFAPTKNAKNTDITIYNVRGQIVRKLDCNDPGYNKAGLPTVTWDCKNSKGKQVPNGVYFYKLSSDNKSMVSKMIIIK